MRFDRVFLKLLTTLPAVALGALLLHAPLGGSIANAADDAAEVASENDLHAGDDGHDHGDGHDEHAGDAGHGGGGVTTSPISWDPDLAVVTAIIFVILMMILGKFAWGPMVEGLDKRESAIAEQIAAARENQDRAAQLLAEHETKLAGAASEVKQMLEQARKDADAQKADILESAQAAAAAEKDRAVREITAAKNEALHEMAQKSVDSAIGLAGKIVKRQLNNDDHSQLVNEALEKFSSDN